jgi:hypothetical protein
MDKNTGFLFLVLFVQLITFIGVWGLMRELRLIGDVVERVRKMLAKRQ